MLNKRFMLNFMLKIYILGNKLKTTYAYSYILCAAFYTYKYNLHYPIVKCLKRIIYFMYVLYSHIGIVEVRLKTTNHYKLF